VANLSRRTPRDGVGIAEAGRSVGRPQANAVTRELCERLFLEPAFGDAAIHKFIWQVKRHMAGMYIEHLHFLVIEGER
jgi:hypothetical protein